MRITNSMMTANTKANINMNKLNADRLNTMITTGQKIVRPSDDPVIAIRALRLNTSIDELTQYHDKNIPDADAWFTDTETALTQADEVLSDVREKLNQAVSEENVTSNVKDILEELKQLKAQFYALGNTDSAGRTVFTGCRTSEMLTFLEADTLNYEINENVSFDKVEKADYVKGTKNIDISGTNINNYSTYSETNITEEEYVRLRVSYGDLKAGSEFNAVIKDKDGDELENITGTVTSLAGKTEAEIDALYTSPTEPVLIQETGELIIPKDMYNDVVSKGAAKVEMTYSKDTWQKGDLRPEHYFQCKTPIVATDPRTYVVDSAGDKQPVEYNYNRVDANEEPVLFGGKPRGFIEQEINYEIAFNQSLTINSHANSTFTHDIGRDIDELVNITQAVATADNNVATVQKAYDAETDPTEKAKYEKLLNAVKKEQDLLKDKMHNMFSSALTSFQKYSDTLNNEISRVGTLTSRLEMTKNRVQDQKDNVKKIADENINADLSETAIDYKSAQLALEAAEMAAGKIANQTLLNYI